MVWSLVMRPWRYPFPAWSNVASTPPCPQNQSNFDDTHAVLFLAVALISSWSLDPKSSSTILFIPIVTTTIIHFLPPSESQSWFSFRSLSQLSLSGSQCNNKGLGRVIHRIPAPQVPMVNPILSKCSPASLLDSVRTHEHESARKHTQPDIAVEDQRKKKYRLQRDAK